MQSSAAQRSTLQISAVQRSAPHRSVHSPVQCSAVQCSAAQCSAVQCSAEQSSRAHRVEERRVISQDHHRPAVAHRASAAGLQRARRRGCTVAFDAPLHHALLHLLHRCIMHRGAMALLRGSNVAWL